MKGPSLAAVAELERYRQADTRIGRVTQAIVLDDNNEGRPLPGADAWHTART